MAGPHVPDLLWEVIKPLLPPEPPKPNGGRPRIPARATLGGILFVLRSGIPWQMLPQELGCGSGMTCWRRLRDWQQAGVWEGLHHALLDRLHDAGQIDWGRVSLDSASIAAKHGGEHTGPNPTDRGKPGTKRHLVVDRHGVPLTVLTSAANVHDSRLFKPLLESIPPLRRRRAGRPRTRPEKVHADKAYDIARCRAYLRRRRIGCRIARRGVESRERLGRYRWVVERTLAWLGQSRRLEVRHEHRVDIHVAFLRLACALICLRYLTAKAILTPKSGSSETPAP